MEQIKKTLKDSAAMRWLVLILISGLTFSTYWFQDFFSGIKPLMISEMGISSSQFGTLIQWTTWANVFGMIIIGGIILDNWGIRRTGIVFGALATLGAALTAMGAAGTFTDDMDSRMWTMMIGRLLFGSGLEVVCVIAMRTIVKWFKGYELALAMAINMGFGRLGSTLGQALSIDIGGGVVSPAVNFAATLIGIGLLMFLIYIMFDVKLDKQMKGSADLEDEEPFRFSDLIKLVTNRSFIFIALLCVTFYSAVFPFMQYAPDLLINKFDFTFELPESATVTLFGSDTLGNASIFIGLFIFALAVTLVPARFKNKQGKTISLLIILGLFALFIYSLRDVFSLWLTNGPKTASLIPLGSILFTPIFGKIVDAKGKAASLMILGASLLIFAHLTLSIFDNVILGYLGLLSLGIAFSLVPAAMWPSVSKIVAENRLGTAYATMFTVQNWGLNLFFWGIGWVLDQANPAVVAKLDEVRKQLKAKDLSNLEISEKIREMQFVTGEIPVFNYTTPILMLVGLGVIAMFLAFMLKRADKKQGYGLELPSGAQSPREMEAEERANIE
ncbi:MAG: MFS transporter [Bacteroidales bacterium]|nr:MFS transporter [Bacteroidales bacterium]MCF8375633.1 MFS transporter [Bacteroidales bacterium]MCF8400784.1 MFS transporter [Bacteroidales bacterium]